MGLYLNAPDRALVLCIDDKSQNQALDRTAPILPLQPGLPERQTHDNKRRGTTTLFAAFSILKGKVTGRCLARQCGREFVRFLRELERSAEASMSCQSTMQAIRPGAMDRQLAESLSISRFCC